MNRTILKWAGVVTVLLVVSRLTGLFRELAISYRFGATAETDAYFIASMIPHILFMAFNDAVKTAFIPVYGEFHREEDGNAFAQTVYVILGGILLVFSALLIVAAPLVVRAVAPGFAAETFSLTVTMSRVMLPGLFFLGMSGLSSGLLHTKKNFVIPALPAYPSNFIIVAGALLFGVRYGVAGLAWATLLGFASQFLIQVPAVVRHGVFKKRKLLWRHPGLKKMAVLLPPVILGGAALELKSIVDRIFGSYLPDGSISALNYANRVYLLPNGILILALLTVLYPTLVELNVAGKTKEFKEMLRRGLGLIILLVFPLMVGMIVLRVQIVRVLFERGAFAAGATESTAFALAFYSLALVALGAQLLINRAFYALKDTVTPMLFTFVMVLLNIFFNWLLIKPLAHGGIALGTSLSVNLGTLGLSYLLYRKIGPFGGRRLLDTFWKCGAAALLMGGAVTAGRGMMTDGGAVRQLVELGVLSGSGAIIYFALVYLLKVEELQLGLGMVRRKLQIK